LGRVGSARALVSMAAMAFRTSPALTLVTVILVPIGELSGVLSSLWLKFIADGVVGHDSRLALFGATMVAVSAGFFLITGFSGNRIALTLTERVGFALERRAAQLVSSVPGIEH